MTASEGAYPPQDQKKAVLHYHRADGDYEGWGLHTWTGAANPTDWTKPLQPVARDSFGVTFEVPRRRCHVPQLHRPPGRREGHLQ
ncbi:pullulanase-associated domain-containing protein [Streptomyces shaanxiensis]